MINKNLRCKDAKINEYIENLENELLKKQTSGIDKFILSVDAMAKALSEEIEALAKGELDKLVLLSNEKDDKLIDRILIIVSKVNSFAQVSDLAEELNKKYVVEDKSKVEEAPDGTVEDMIEKKKNKK